MRRMRKTLRPRSRSGPAAPSSDGRPDWRARLTPLQRLCLLASPDRDRGGSLSALVVFSCDQKYFPLAKGLVLSLKGAGLGQSGIGLAFIDIGCTPQALQWFSDQGVRVL